VALTQHILGVRPELGGLRVSPCLPGSMGTLEVTRRCRGAEYRITVKNQGAGQAPRLVVDGNPLEGTLVPWAPEGAKVTVEVTV
jgi:cellobiose phosphorylase